MRDRAAFGGCSSWTGLRSRGFHRRRRRSYLPERHQPQDNVDAFLSFSRRVVGRSLLANKIDRFTDTGVAELDPRNDDGVELGIDARGPGGIALKGFAHRANDLPVTMHGLLPAFLDRPQRAGSGLVIRFLGILGLNIVEPLFAAAGRSVIGIEREDLLIFLVREIVASGLIIGFGIGQQPFYFLNLGQEFRAHRAATDCLGGGGRNARAGDADAAVAEISEQLGRGPAIGTVAVVQNLAQNRFRFRVARPVSHRCRKNP